MIDTNDAPLTDEEQAILKAAGYEARGGGNINGDGVVWVRYRKQGQTYLYTRASWRVVIAELQAGLAWAWESERGELAMLADRLTPEQCEAIIRQLVKTDEHKLAVTLAGMITGYVK